MESPTEVQKFLVNQILSELVKTTTGETEMILIVKEMAKWLGLTTNGPKSRVMIDGISMGYASIRSRQSTSSTVKSESEPDSAYIKYTFIAMTSILLEKIPSIITDRCPSDEGLIPLIEALGRFMKLKV